MIQKTKIEPEYVNFNQAALLKKKGFDVEVIKYWNGISEDFDTKDYFNWNQSDKFASIPEQWQVVEWLRITHNLWIEVSNCNIPERGKWYFDINRLPCGVVYLWNKEEPVFDSPQAAYSAAFDYVLKKLIK